MSTTHKKTPWTITQLRVVNVHNDDNHELIQSFDEVVSIQQPWWYATLGYNLPRIGVFTPIITSPSFQNQQSHTNIHLVPINSKMEWFHLLNRLEQLCHVNWRLSNQSIFIPHVEPIELRTTPIVIWQGVIYPQGIWLATSIFGPGERSQVPHRRLVSGGN